MNDLRNIEINLHNFIYRLYLTNPASFLYIHIRCKKFFSGRGIILKHARMKDLELSLTTLPREDYQRIYEASLKNDVTCKACGKPVKLYIGINQQPHFYHVMKEDGKTCNELDSHPSTQSNLTPQHSIMESNYMEHSGFRLPKSRAIAATEKPLVSEWRPPAALKGRTPFIIKSQPASSLLGIPLDNEQKKAVTTIDGPLLILAGAGSGKTRVLTTRALYMMEEKSIDPKSMMLVTFTAKAAREMHERIKTNATKSA